MVQGVGCGSSPHLKTDSMTIKYNTQFDFWLKYYGITIIEQCNNVELISFHSWKNKKDLLSTPTRFTVAIWTVKKKVV